MNDTPLVLLQTPYLRAIDRRSGKLLWEVVVGGDEGDTFPGRLFPAGDSIYVIAGERLFHVDRRSGKLETKATLPFAPDTALFDGDCFYISDVPNAAAIEVSGTLRWKATVDQGILSDTLVCRDAAGKTLWRRDHIPSHGSPASAGMMIGDLVSQPDAKGRS